jgi:ribosome-binding factor A
MSRTDRVSEAIREEVSLILHEKVKDPRLGFVTVTRVELAPDMRFAKVFFSVLGGAEDYKKTYDALESAKGFIRSLVAERINLRLAPELAFYEDRSAEYSVRIQELLDEVKSLASPEPAARPKAVRKKRKKGVRGVAKVSRRVRKKK